MANTGRNHQMFLLPPLHDGDFRDRLEGRTRTAPAGTESALSVGRLVELENVPSVGRLVELDSREKDPNRGPHLETECVLISLKENVRGVLDVSTLIPKGIRRDHLHPGVHIMLLPRLDGKEERTSVVVILLPERVVAKVDGALLRTEKRPPTRNQSLVSCG